MNLEDCRREIDEVDEAILGLLNRRAQVVVEVGKIKRSTQQELYVPSRERAIFERLERLNAGPFPTEAITRVYREIISASLALEHPLKVSYLGPEATFTHAAALEVFGLSAKLIPVKTIPAAFAEIESGRTTYGVVPVENSNVGGVAQTFDQFMEADLKIIAEHYLEVSHDLLSVTDKLETIDRIYSHAMAFEQCRPWLENHCPDVKLIEVSSTSVAAQMARRETGAAAIASRHAAHLYDLFQLATRIETHHHNYTRFWVIGQRLAQPTGRDKTTVMFGLNDRLGMLNRMFEPFSRHGLKLTKIDSRPIKNRAWDYLFFIDIEGHCLTEDIQGALDELRPLCSIMKILGSYPRTGQ